MTVLQIEDRRETKSTDMRPPFTERGALRVVVPHHSFFGSCSSSLRALVARKPPSGRYQVNSFFFRLSSRPRRRFAGRSASVSLVLHCAIVALIVYLPPLTPIRATTVEPVSTTVERIYYQVPAHDDPPKIPQIAPKLSGQPSPALAVNSPAVASTVQRPNITIVSTPAHPDNFRQTIFQPTVPPDVRITTDQRVPNIVMGQELDSVKAPLDPSTDRPVQINRQVSQVDAPSVSESVAKQPMMAFLRTSESEPQLTIPVSSGGAPIQRTAGPAGSSAAKPTNAAGLMVLSVDPAPPNDQFSLPVGNRWGQFSITPPAAAADPSTGTASTAPGSKESGMPSANSSVLGAVSISEPASSPTSEGGALDPALPMNMIYPIAAPPLNIRRNTMIISAGPIGGGGLNVYGALKCGKIYSVFLPMPDRNWSMQYCDSSAKPASVSSAGYTTVLRLEDPLRPPDVDLSHRFDFKRLPVSIDKAHRSIILKGTIASDGTVQHLVVYQGLQPKMDEAARIAFSRWRFKPATRDGKPVSVEVLVGIPPEVGEDRISR
ncbi:MAG: energy transducer TonB [Candidatus Acidiferrales bacterium]